ncbi:MAG: HAMP domain-containing sensor histidine kinase [Spirochaetia bacterium]|jgi:signal transduction histidine kinase|nr:HAMP domain-containing sensor histidine kinase [Spirochaetia bacterium]
MQNLTKYNFRLFLLTSFLYIVINSSNLIYPVYVSAPLCLIPWLIFDVFLPDHIASAKYTGSILESIAILSAMLLINTYLFSGFLILVLYYNFRTIQFRNAALINAGLILIFISLKILLGTNLISVIVLIPVVSLSYILEKVNKETESEMKSEIEAQQNHIDGKNKLLSTLAHELRTPLAVIRTSTEIILEERPGEINTTQRRFLTAVLDNAMRMVHFVDTILASIKVEYAWFRMNKKPIDIRTVIKKVCNELLPFISSREQELKYTYPNLISRTIADGKWIQQVLINLIHNASKHIGINGRIIISVTENEQCIVVSVSDDGSGIMNQEKPKIFSEFYQGSESEDENMEGAGLGLSIVKDVIEKHNGKVYVGSVVGLGTTLSFTLPKEGGAGCSTKF